ncbi:MAG: hypothetical protein JRS35_11415 [Deltaproteobacteria bacterium]|nr:hypothetical protein [Deltaproteobacteria bacterium]
MLVLPLIDLLILAGTALLGVGFLLKAYAVVMSKGLAILGFSSMDFVVLAGVCWGFALVLAARSWVKLNEGNLMSLRREQVQAQARRQAQEIEFAHDHVTNEVAGGAEPRRTRGAEAEGS